MKSTSVVGVPVHHALEHRSDDIPDLGEGLARAAPHRGGMLGGTEDRAVAVVVELGEVAAPRDVHGEAGLEQDAERRAQALRPASSTGPTAVCAQSIERISAPISPPPARTLVGTDGCQLNCRASSMLRTSVTLAPHRPDLAATFAASDGTVRTHRGADGLADGCSTVEPRRNIDAERSGRHRCDGGVDAADAGRNAGAGPRAKRYRSATRRR